MYSELYTACIVAFFYILRISELEFPKWGDIPIEPHDGENYLSIRTKQSKTDIVKGGVLRSLIGIDSMLCHVKTFRQWGQMAFNAGG